MCGWLSGAIHGVRTMPGNPSDIGLMARYARDAEEKLSALASIAADLDWHMDADLDLAWEQIQDYDKKWRSP